MKKNYITAVLEMLHDGQEPSTVLEGLKRTLKQKGHERLYASVLRGVERVLEAHGAETSRVVVASNQAYEKQKTAILSALQSLSSVNTHKVVVDETIIGGFIAEANDKQMDASYKTKLVSLYRNLTK